MMSTAQRLNYWRELVYGISLCVYDNYTFIPIWGGKGGKTPLKLYLPTYYIR